MRLRNYNARVKWFREPDPIPTCVRRIGRMNSPRCSRASRKFEETIGIVDRVDRERVSSTLGTRIEKWMKVVR